MHPSRRADLPLVLLWIVLAGAGVAALLLASRWLSLELAAPLQGASTDVIALSLEWLIASLIFLGVVIGGLASLMLGPVHERLRRHAGAARREHSA